MGEGERARFSAQIRGGDAPLASGGEEGGLGEGELDGEEGDTLEEKSVHSCDTEGRINIINTKRSPLFLVTVSTNAMFQKKACS